MVEKLSHNRSGILLTPQNGGVKGSMSNMSNTKQPEPDKTITEFIKNLGPKAIDTLLVLHNKFWTSNMSLPADWTNAVIIPILKPGKPTEEMT
jgi:hypothetical protein